MSLLKRILFFAVIAGALMAQASTVKPVEACYEFKGQGNRTYISKISIYGDSVSVSELGLSGENYGGMRGRALDMTVKPGVIEIKNLTLNDRDSWIDDVYIKITDKTVTYSTPGDQSGPQAMVRLTCPKKK
jgi:hypothetical protein